MPLSRILYISICPGSRNRKRRLLLAQLTPGLVRKQDEEDKEDWWKRLCQRHLVPRLRSRLPEWVSVMTCVTQEAWTWSAQSPRYRQTHKYTVDQGGLESALPRIPGPGARQYWKPIGRPEPGPGQVGHQEVLLDVLSPPETTGFLLWTQGHF